MKVLLLLSFLTTTAFAAETKTECPWMREMSKRNNPKAEMFQTSTKSKVESKSASTSGQ